MNILFIAPFSLPHTGNSLPIKVMYDHLIAKHDVSVINLSKGSYSSGGFALRKVYQTLCILFNVWKQSRNKDIIYLTIAESFGGNMRDLLIYIICRKKLDNVIIHMLGGAMMRSIIEKRRGFQFKLNKYFISRLAGVIVEGKMQADFFSIVTQSNKIHIVPNFAEEYLFASEEMIEEKFSSTKPVKILFLSNLLHGKGYMELAQAFLSLNEDLRKQFEIDFAGGFETEKDQNDFLKIIQDDDRITYRGHVIGETKRSLYFNAHVFCLPTYYPYEGQPFCILEAYAAGNVVVTTAHSGIPHIFNSDNGYEVEKGSVESLQNTMVKILEQRKLLKNIALHNLREAQQKYSVERYKSDIKKALNSHACIEINLS